MTTAEYIKENKRRVDAINEHKERYNPFTGEHSFSVERVRVAIPDFVFPVMYLPKEMLEEDIVKQLIEADSLKSLFKKISLDYTKENINKFTKAFFKIRFKYDFEFWAIMTIKITGKGLGRDIEFKLRYAQLILLKELEMLRVGNKPIDIILLKARQWGGSTLIQLYMFWIQLIHKKNWNSVICGDVESQSSIVAGMLSKALRNYPTWATDGEELTSHPFERSNKTRIIEYTNCIYSLGSAQKPESLRSQDISMAHLTEVGLWKETKGKKPEDLVQSIFGSINYAPYTMKVIESTAKGVGNYFHRTWQDACAKKNNFNPVFIAWFQIDIYSEDIDDYESFIATMDEYDKYLFSLGATLEAINWYKHKAKEFHGDHWRMCSEFPSTPEEAFQSTGRNFYPINDVENLRKYIREPECIGELIAKDTHGEDAITDIKFHKADNGCLKIWSMPDFVDMENRYVVVMDVSKGISAKADNGVICVFDRYWMKDINGVPEVVAEWCGHIPMRYLVWKGVQIAKFYDNAFLVIESNTPETSGQSGFEMDSVFDEIAGYYDNLYCREPSAEQIRKGRTRMWGFHTNKKTKTTICTHQQIILAEDGYIEPCREAIDEHKTFEVKHDGSLGAVEGCHDDRHITRALGNWICYKHLDIPRIRDEKEKGNYIVRTKINESSF